MPVSLLVLSSGFASVSRSHIASDTGIRLIILILNEVGTGHAASPVLPTAYKPLQLLAYAEHPAATPSRSSFACPVSHG